MRRINFDEQHNHLLKVRVDHQGTDQWFMKPEFTKKSHAANNGHYMFRGDDEAFRRYLMKMKACDTDSDPPSYRNVKYKDMVQGFKAQKRTYMWVYSSKWNANNRFGEEIMKKEIIEIKEECEIPGTNIILEKGDKIEILQESELDILGAVLYDIFLYGKSDKLMMNNLKMEYDGVIGKKLIVQTMKSLDIDLNYKMVFDLFSEYRIKIT